MAETVNSNPSQGSIREPSKGQRRAVLTAQEVLAYALSSLGFPNVSVEAKDTQVTALMQAALDEYNRWRPIEKNGAITGVSPDIQKYDLEELEVPFGRGICDVQFPTHENFFAPISAVYAPLGVPYQITHLSPDSYQLSLMYIKGAQKAYSSAPDWEWQEPILWVYAPKGFGGPYSIGYTYMADALSPEEIRTQDVKWFKDYFTALLTKAVGRARSKFTSGIPGPSGTQLDGSALVQEANEELQRLSLDLQSKAASQAPPYFPTGGY